MRAPSPLATLQSNAATPDIAKQHKNRTACDFATTPDPGVEVNAQWDPHVGPGPATPHTDEITIAPRRDRMQALQWFSPCFLDVHALGSTQDPPQSRNSILLSTIAQATQNNIGITYTGGEITQPAGTKVRRRNVPPSVIQYTNVDGQALAQRHHNTVIQT